MLARPQMTSSRSRRRNGTRALERWARARVPPADIPEAKARISSQQNCTVQRQHPQEYMLTSSKIMNDAGAGMAQWQWRPSLWPEPADTLGLVCHCQYTKKGWKSMGVECSCTIMLKKHDDIARSCNILKLMLRLESWLFQLGHDGCHSVILKNRPVNQRTKTKQLDAGYPESPRQLYFDVLISQSMGTFYARQLLHHTIFATKHFYTRHPWQLLH